tara:strand:- start:720 stop:971 length:252 start_codon:yes stop_codon:yes gene_type:complete
MSENKESKFLRFAYYAIPFLLVFYVLSIGPAYALLTNVNGCLYYPEYRSQIETFYAPVFIMATTNSWLRSLLMKYVDFWKRKF